MTRTPHRDFGVHWYITYALVAVCTLPLGRLGWVEWWPAFTEALCLLGLGIFIGVENLAKVARSIGHSGTKTSWTYWKVDDPSAPVWAAVVRSMIGLWMGLVVYWRLPAGPAVEVFGWQTGLVKLVVGGFLVSWLPYHFVWPKDGPWERFGGWLVTLPGFRHLKAWIDG